ncbi:MAG: alpha/beta hydrolase [Planctomycetota bacterium]
MNLDGSLGLVALLGFGLVFAFIATSALIRHRLTRPPRRTYAWAVARSVPGDPGEMPEPPEWTAWRVSEGKTDFEVWDINGDNPHGPDMLLVHGWSDSRIGALPRLAPLLPRCARVLVFDLPAQGDRRDGVPLTMGHREHEDVARVLRAREAASRPVILFGWSLGGGVAIQAGAMLAGSFDIRAVIAEAPYRMPLDPARNVLDFEGIPRHGTLELAMGVHGILCGAGWGWRGFDRTLHAAELLCPLLVLHGTEDETCPFDSGRAIAQAATNGQLAPIKGGFHTSLWTDERTGPQSHDAVAEFLDSLGDQPA